MDGQVLFLKIEKWVNARKEDFPLAADTQDGWKELGGLMENLGATLVAQAVALTPVPEPAADDASTPADHGIADPGFGKDLAPEARDGVSVADGEAALTGDS